MTSAPKKIFLQTLIGSLCVSALIAIFIFLLGSFGEIEVRILLTTLTIGCYSLTGLCCAALGEKRPSSVLAPTGMLVSVIGFLVNTVTIWEIADIDDTWQTVVILHILAVALAHAALMLHIQPRANHVRSSLAGTLVMIGIVAGMLIALVLAEGDINSEFYFRLIGVFAILDVLGTIVTPILHKMSSAISSAQSPVTDYPQE